MKHWFKISCLFLTGAVLFSSLPAAAAAPSEIYSDAYCVMDAATGQILIQKNMDKREYPASITKILTLALALENANLDDVITVQSEDVITDYSASHIALQEGEQLSVRDAAEAAIINSANDAANCLGQYKSGSLSAFVELMNQKAAELCALNTHFTNANGLPDENHYTTAADMARITRWAMTIPAFREFFDDTAYTMGPTNKQAESRLFGTDNLMVVESKYYYDGVLGGKLGWTQEAGHTMVTAAEREGRQLICVVMNSQHKYEEYKDAHALLDYCFSAFEPVSITGLTLPESTIPAEKDGKKLGDVKLVAADAYTFLLESGLTADDVNIAYNLPDRYVPGEAFSPTVSFTLKTEADGTEADLGTFPLEYDLPESLVDGAPDEKVPIEESAKTPLSHFLWKGAALLLMLLTALTCLLQKKKRLSRD